MLERQTPSWGPNVRESGQVHCVRRLGLTNEDWESTGVMQRGPFAEPRHITCVKMSPERADEVGSESLCVRRSSAGHLLFRTTLYISLFHIRLPRFCVHAARVPCSLYLPSCESRAEFNYRQSTSASANIYAVRF